MDTYLYSYQLVEKNKAKRIQNNKTALKHNQGIMLLNKYWINKLALCFFLFFFCQSFAPSVFM